MSFEVHSPEEIIGFWQNAGYDRWYKADPAFDDEIRARFSREVDLALSAGLLWSDDEHAALATILLLDQFTRNIFRGTPRAFAGDGRGVAEANRAIERGFDKRYSEPLRSFFYIPFTHGEDIVDQRRGEQLYAADGNTNGLKWATIHREIIEKFGRFPHRNAILERVSTAEEQAFLNEGGFAG